MGKASVRNAGHMRLVETIIEEEGLVLVGIDEGCAAVEEILRHLVVLPTCCVTSLHEADASDAVDECVVVPVGPLHAYELGMRECSGLAREVLVVADLNGVVGIETHDAAVLHIDRRHAIHGGCDDAGIVETYLARPRRDALVPVYLAYAHAEMPFADGRCGVAGTLEHLRHSELLG